MQKKIIASFAVDHRGMQPGVYFREDQRCGVSVLTADLRFYKPNAGQYLTTTEAHTIEHLLATYLRSSAYADNIVYFGPMGCRTGFYLVTLGLDPDTVCALLREVIALSFSETAVPGASPAQCGNYRDLSLQEAVEVLRLYLPHCIRREYRPLETISKL